jgi:DNA-binding SARP family transcriptional activator/Tfp pilus assembly protein PilF
VSSSSTESGKGRFLRVKLLPPRPGRLMLERPRLIERIVENLSHPVTIVTANAGTGKTTLVADFVNKLAERYVWYQLDQTDADPTVFLRYITNGIRQINHGFGETTLAYLNRAPAQISKYPEYAVDVLINEMLEDIEHQFILVLDDYHNLGIDTPVHAIVDRMIARLPELLHSIVISRDMPPLQLARLRSRGALSIIGRSDLLFNDEETQALFHEVFDLEMTNDKSAAYRERADGWITSLHLVRHITQRQSTAQTEEKTATAAAPPDLKVILEKSEHDIFEYFAEVVFSGESEEIRRLLLRLSLIRQIELDACIRLYPESDCAATLPALVRRNIFIVAVGVDGNEEYRIHPMFQNYLRRRVWMYFDRKELPAEHTRIAEYFLEQGDLRRATRHLLAAQDFERAAALIAEKGHEWAGPVSLASTFDALPPDLVERFPRALIFRGELERLRCEYDIAQPLLQRAAQLMRDKNDGGGEAEALHSLAAIAHQRGEHAVAFEYLDRAIALAGDRSLTRAMAGNTRGLCFLALQRWAEADAEFRSALQMAEELKNEDLVRIIVRNLGLPPMVRGDFAQALQWWRRLLCGDKNRPPSLEEALAHLNAAYCHFYLGELEDCEKHLDEANEYCRLLNLTELNGEVLEALGNLHRKRGDHQRAADYCARAARISRDAEIDQIPHGQLDGQARFKRDMLPPDLRDQLVDRTAPQTEVVTVTEPIGDLTINMLGPVEIIRDPKRPFAAGAWTTKRARDILCFIASRPHRRASKETIFENFWTEEDSENITKDFHPTVSQIRKALNSNQQLKLSFLLYGDGVYYLNSEYAYVIDLEDFDRWVSEGETALRAGQVDRGISFFENAIRLYRGGFMQGVNDDWIDEQRVYYSEQYLRILEYLVVEAQKNKEWQRSLQFAHKLLREDPFREDIHCRVMRAHAELNDSAAVKEQYETLCGLLRKGLVLEPSTRTTAVYLQLLA